MNTKLKVLVVEEDAVELEAPTEAYLSIQNIHNENNLNKDLFGFNLEDILTWIRRNSIYKRYFLSEDIEVPIGHVMQMHSPVVDGEVLVDGEVYIL